jgi:hypothetical protein
MIIKKRIKIIKNELHFNEHEDFAAGIVNEDEGP